MMQRPNVPLRDWFFGLFGRRVQAEEVKARSRGPATHVIILDGTASSLQSGRETNAGLTFGLLKEADPGANLTLHYEAGIQWRDWRGTWDVVTGKGINRMIRRAYGVLASRYRPGDKIVLIGYSRGAYAVRSLAGIVDMVGLVKANHATVSAIRTAYRHYEAGATSDAAKQFNEIYCHGETPIEAVAVWDTVKALGLRLPILWRVFPSRHSFHNSALGPSIHNGFHALAHDERRVAYRPIMWKPDPEWQGKMEQVWFRGTHSDVGGQVAAFPPARPLANVSLVWMLGRLELCGLTLPIGWRNRLPVDRDAPSVGAWYGWSKLFWYRRRRTVGADPSERLDSSVTGLDLTEQAAPAHPS